MLNWNFNELQSVTNNYLIISRQTNITEDERCKPEYVAGDRLSCHFVDLAAGNLWIWVIVFTMTTEMYVIVPLGRRHFTFKVSMLLWLCMSYKQRLVHSLDYFFLSFFPLSHPGSHPDFSLLLVVIIVVMVVLMLFSVLMLIYKRRTKTSVGE